MTRFEDCACDRLHRKRQRKESACLSLRAKDRKTQHKPLLVVEGIPAGSVDQVFEYATHPKLDEVDRVVVDYSIAVTNAPQRIRDEVFERLRRHFSDAQIVELTLRIALCGFFNRFNDALQIDGGTSRESP